MKRLVLGVLFCSGLILSRSPLSFSDYIDFFGSAHSGEALAYDCSCYTIPASGCDEDPNGIESMQNFNSDPWCMCTNYGVDVCDEGGGGTGGLTEEQIAALEALLQALQDARNAAGNAASDLASLTDLYNSIAALQATFSNAEENVIEALSDIDSSLDLLSGYMAEGQALGEEALQLVAEQVTTALINRGIAEDMIRNKMAAEILPQPMKKTNESGFFLWYQLPEPWTGRAFEEQARIREVNLFCSEKFVVGNSKVAPAIRIALTEPEMRQNLTEELPRIVEILQGEYWLSEGIL